MMNKGDLSNAQENLANEELFMIIFVIMIVHYNYNTFIGLVRRKIRSNIVIHILHFTYSWHHFPARYLTRPGRLSVIEWRTRKLLSTVRIETTCLVYHFYLNILKVHIGYESITFIQFIHIHNLHHLHPISVVCEVVHILRLKIQHCKTETEIVCLIRY